MHEIFGGFVNGALARLHYLTRRSARVDRTEYVAWNALQYATHWAQRISAAIVFGDAQRALAQVDKLKRQLTTSTSTCSHHNPPGGQQATFASPDARDRRKRCHRVGARGRH